MIYLSVLKTCPFCDGIAEVYIECDEDNMKSYGVRCYDCGASLPKTYEFRDYAIKLWNMRGWNAKNVDIDERND